MTSASAFPNLQTQQYSFLLLTTFRKNGDPVATPVWFAQENDRIYVITSIHTGKVKRARNNPAVTVAPCTPSGKPLGEAVKAKIVGIHTFDQPQAKHGDEVLNRKYKWQKRLGFGLINFVDINIRRKPLSWVILEIAPET